MACAGGALKLRKSVPKGTWFDVDKKYRYLSQTKEMRLNAFFDVPYKENSETKNIYNAVVMTPMGSRFIYDFDIKSGSLYKKTQNCEYEDSWKRYGGDLFSPNFSVGFIPGYLDQLGKKQEVYIFSSKGALSDYKRYEDNVYSIRLLGGGVEQFCDSFPCGSRSKWLSRMVLYAVIDGDESFAHVQSLDDLKKAVDWEKAKAYMENFRGSTTETSGEIRPAYRLLNDVDLAKTLDFIARTNHIFSFESSRSMQKSCHALYDYVWSNVENIRETEKIRKGEKESKYRKLTKKPSLKDNVYNGEIKANRSKKELARVHAMKFHKFFKYFYQKYRSEFMTCSKFVQMSSINDDVERHWFFSYFASYFQLESLGYVYSCSKGSWVENPVLSSGKKFYNARALLHTCSDEELEKAFDRSVTVMSGNKGNNRAHYRYIEYDSGIGGSHNKMYSWVYESGKKLSCEKRRDEHIFPEDVTWSPISPEKINLKDGYIF